MQQYETSWKVKYTPKGANKDGQEFVVKNTTEVDHDTQDINFSTFFKWGRKFARDYQVGITSRIFWNFQRTANTVVSSATLSYKHFDISGLAYYNRNTKKITDIYALARYTASPDRQHILKFAPFTHNL
jgi:hypothetical protein